VLTSIAGSVLLLLSGLGVIDLLRNDGGIVGGFIAAPFLKLFDVYAALIILSSFVLISLLLVFDTTPPVQKLLQWISGWRRKRKEEKIETRDRAKQYEPEDENIEEEEEDGEDESEEETHPQTQEKTKPKNDLMGMFSFKKTGGHQSMLPLEDSPLQKYTPPPLSLLGEDGGKPGVGDIKANANIIKRTLQHFGIDVEMDEISVGPSVTRYALKPAQGVKLSRIVGLQNDLSLALAAHPIRIEAPIPGKSLVGIEIPNSTRTRVGLSSLLEDEGFQKKARSLLFSLGRDVGGKPYFGDLTRMPHLLIAGATGSGKSVVIHTIIAALIYRSSPGNLRFILIDPKRVELTLYNTIPHLLTPVITDAKKTILALKWASKEMERRYDIFETESVRDIDSYHKNIVVPAYAKAAHDKLEEEEEPPNLPEKMPYIVIIIDELADIMSTYPRELEAAVIRLAQMSRATGIHLILSTQRPSVNIITGLIKANIPSRIAFQVASQTDSRTILDGGGAEKLLGAGDMLYLSGEMSKPVRLQSAYIGESEIKKIVKFLSQTHGEPSYDINLASVEQDKSSIFDAMEDSENLEEEDELYKDARETIIAAGKASTTFLQRKLRIGYARAARLMDILEEEGVVGPADGARPREVLIKLGEEYEKQEEENENDEER